jgi:urea transport system permease protein
MQPGQSWKRTATTTAVLALVLVVLLPLLNLAGILSDYYLNLFGKYLSLAILALGMDLVWGYAGILCLGQAVFFGLGAYAMGMYLMLASSGHGVYGAAIPDFMVWNRVHALPLFWRPFRYFPLAVLGALAVPMAAGAVVGFLTFRRRVGGTYFAILTQAMAFAVWLMFNRNELNLGGTNGLTDFKVLLGFSLRDPATLRGLYVVTAVALVASFWVSATLVSSKMGLVLTAARDQEQRLEFLGYPVANYKTFVLAFSGLLAGLGGALYVPQVGIITPSEIGVFPSLQVVVWVATGGRGTLLGAVMGAIGINGARSVLTARAPEWWPVILGAIFAGVVLFVPDGLIAVPGMLREALGRMRARSARLRTTNLASVQPPAP